MAKKTKTWNTEDITLQHLYGLSLFDQSKMHPYFGSALQLQLTIGHFVTRKEHIWDEEKKMLTVKREGETSLQPPTLLNLAWHFGHMQWAVDNVATLIRQSKGDFQGSQLDRRFFIAAQDYARREFEAMRVLPLRKTLAEQGIPLYLYCVPSVSIETELETGKPLMAEGDRVLCVLPKTVKAAREYGLTEMEINLLAPQVIWLIKTLCSAHAIRTSEQLVTNLNGWVEYLNPGIADQIQEAIGRINPHLLTPRVRQALLPSVS